MLHNIGRSARVRRVIDWVKEVLDAKTKPWFRAEFVHPREFGPYLPLKETPTTPEAQPVPERQTRELD